MLDDKVYIELSSKNLDFVVYISYFLLFFSCKLFYNFNCRYIVGLNNEKYTN